MDTRDKITYLGVTDTRILMDKIKKQSTVIQAARDLLTELYALNAFVIQDLPYYGEIENLELALTELDE